MRLLGNILWIVLGGIETAMCYFTASLVCFITIVGIPFGLQLAKMSFLCLWPFGSEVVSTGRPSGCLTTLFHVLWLIPIGFLVCLAHLFFGGVLCLTIIGIPFGLQHLKLATFAINPFGQEVRLAQL